MFTDTNENITSTPSYFVEQIVLEQMMIPVILLDCCFSVLNHLLYTLQRNGCVRRGYKYPGLFECVEMCCLPYDTLAGKMEQNYTLGISWLSLISGARVL